MKIRGIPAQHRDSGGLQLKYHVQAQGLRLVRTEQRCLVGRAVSHRNQPLQSRPHVREKPSPAALFARACILDRSLLASVAAHFDVYGQILHLVLQSGEYCCDAHEVGAFHRAQRRELLADEAPRLRVGGIGV